MSGKDKLATLNSTSEDPGFESVGFLYLGAYTPPLSGDGLLTLWRKAVHANNLWCCRDLN